MERARECRRGELTVIDRSGLAAAFEPTVLTPKAWRRAVEATLF